MTVTQGPDAADDAPASRLVLVIDDEDGIRAVVRRALARDGWTVEEAVDGTSALLQLRVQQRSWAAILLDLSLPGIHGHDLYEVIRVERPDLVNRLAFTSGAPSAFAEKTGRPVLQKPFELPALRELVQRLAAG
ncbi:MAG: response regulator [Gemmatimonadaceae bacterium]